MADKKDYYIYVAGEKVLISKEIYDAITQMDRQERTQSDKDKRNKLLRYEELTTASVTGEELLYDSTQESVEETVVTTIMCSKLRNGLTMLSPEEREFIENIYFRGCSVRQMSKKIGIPTMTVQDRKAKILAKLKKFLENWKIFRTVAISLAYKGWGDFFRTLGVPWQTPGQPVISGYCNNISECTSETKDAP